MNPTYAQGAYMQGYSMGPTWIDEPFKEGGPKFPFKDLQFTYDTAAISELSEKIATIGKEMAASFTLNVEQIGKLFDIAPAMLTADGGSPKPWNPLEPRAIQPTHRRFSRQEIVRALEHVVRRAGWGHVSTTNSTNSPDPSGLRCIQGELMLELGFDRDAQLPGTYAGVAELLSGRGSYDQELQSALAYAQHYNDHHEAWGHILQRVRFQLAA